MVIDKTPRHDTTLLIGDLIQKSEVSSKDKMELLEGMVYEAAGTTIGKSLFHSVALTTLPEQQLCCLTKTSTYTHGYHQTACIRTTLTMLLSMENSRDQ